MSVASKGSIGSVSSHELLSTPEARKGEEILTEARREIECFPHIIPLSEAPPLTREFVEGGEGFKQFGARFYKLLKHHIFLGTLRKAGTLLSKEIDSSDLKENMVFDFARAKMGIGGCFEVNHTIGAKAVKAGLPEIFSLIFQHSKNRNDKHNFIIFGKGMVEEIITHMPKNPEPRIDILKFIEKFKSGIILDGYFLSKPLAARDVRQSSEFANSIKRYDELLGIVCYKQTAEEMDQLLEQAEKLKARMIEVLPKVPLDQRLVELSNALNENEPSLCVRELGNRIPNTKWSKNAEKRMVWFEGSEEKAKEIFEYLQAHCIKAGEPSRAKSGNWVVILTNPYFEQIECLPSFEKWKNKKKSDEKKSPEESPSGTASCALSLEKHIPGTKWKKNVTKNLVWFEGTKEKATEIRRYLKLHCIQASRKRVEKSDNYVVMLTDPDFELIEKLPPYDPWKTRQIVFLSSLPKDEDE